MMRVHTKYGEKGDRYTIISETGEEYTYFFSKKKYMTMALRAG